VTEVINNVATWQGRWDGGRNENEEIIRLFWGMSELKDKKWRILQLYVVQLFFQSCKSMPEE